MQTINFLLISDPKIWAMTVKECHEPLIDLKTRNVAISNARASFYSGFTKVRETVALKLEAASKMLPHGMAFLFSEGHRPISLQRKMFIEYCAVLKQANPDWDEATVRREASQFIAPPEDVPPHSTGGAIDITLLDREGREIDMGSALDAVPGVSENDNFTTTPSISSAAKANRQILIDVLSAVGFVNYPAEWWHWSYGDKYWAYHAGRPHAIYGSID